MCCRSGPRKPANSRDEEHGARDAHGDARWVVAERRQCAEVSQRALVAGRSKRRFVTGAAGARDEVRSRGGNCGTVGCRRRVCGCDQRECCAISRASCAISRASCAISRASSAISRACCEISRAGVRDFSGGKRDFSGGLVDDKDRDSPQGRDRRQAHRGAASRRHWEARWSWRASAIGGAGGAASHAVTQQHHSRDPRARQQTRHAENGSGPCA